MRALLDEGWKLLSAGDSAAARDLFGRVLLQDPGCGEARRGLTQARAGTDEALRRLDARLDDALSALASGDHEAARALLEHVIENGGDRDRARAALDRLDSRGGRVDEPLMLRAEESSEAGRATASAAAAWARRGLVALCGFGFVLLAVGVDAHWETLLRALEDAPRPLSAAAPPSLPVSPRSPGEQAVADARRLLEQGDAAGAMRTLDAVGPEEPAYPFARQLRTQAESALRLGRWR